MLEIIITETTSFFAIWVFFHEHSRVTGQQRKGEAFFYSLWGTNIFGEKNYGEVILKRGTSDQVMPWWGKEFHK